MATKIASVQKSYTNGCIVIKNKKVNLKETSEKYNWPQEVDTIDESDTGDWYLLTFKLDDEDKFIKYPD